MTVAMAVALLVVTGCGNDGGDGREGADATSGDAPRAPGYGAPADEPTGAPASGDLKGVELEERRGRWASHEPAAYRFTIAQICFCPTEYTQPRTVTVEAGAAVSIEPPIDSLQPPIDIPTTVDDLFQTVEDAMADADAVEVVYDNEFDFPASIVIDRIRDAIDDETTYQITDFEVVAA
jgi:hypothetical protein